MSYLGGNHSIADVVGKLDYHLLSLSNNSFNPIADEFDDAQY